MADNLRSSTWMSETPGVTTQRPEGVGQLAPATTAWLQVAALAVVLCACAPFSPGPSTPTPEPRVAVDSSEVLDAAPAYITDFFDIEPDPDQRVLAILLQADAWLAADSIARATALYQQVVAMDDAEEWDGSGSLRARALWGLAVTHLLGSAPSTEHARTLFRRLEAYAHTPEGALAAWIGGILDELTRLRAHSAEQEEAIRNLNATMDRLKQIDLNRRPGGPDPQRPPTP
jgi:hypothetical protein